MDLDGIQQFSTLVKVKRRRNEANPDSLVIKFKKRRRNEGDTEKFLSYAGTLTPNQSESREEVTKFAQHFVDKNRLQSFSAFRDRKRTNFEQERKERRLKIIDSYRNIGSESEKPDNCVVINAENFEENGTENGDDNDDDDCVFDVFIAPGGEEIYEFDDLDILIQEAGDASYLVQEADSDDSLQVDRDSDSDSNVENNGANEYPDSEPDDFDDYLLDRVQKLRLGYELSSDEYSDYCSSDHEHSYYKKQEKLFNEICSNEEDSD